MRIKTGTIVKITKQKTILDIDEDSINDLQFEMTKDQDFPEESYFLKTIEEKEEVIKKINKKYKEKLTYKLLVKNIEGKDNFSYKL